MTRYRWIEPDNALELDYDLSDSPLLTEIAARRGLTTRAELEAFFSPSLSQLGDPFLLPDMRLAVERVMQAVNSDSLIAIFGDYDVDGITSTAMLERALRYLGARTRTYLPHRERDGYGLNLGAIDDMSAAGASVVITLDCGTSDQTEIDHARARGLSTIVVDHHRVGHAELPHTAFVSPRRSTSEYPFEDLAAVGVTYHLVRALVGDDKAQEYLPLAALGTVADVVPLVGDNRVFTSVGLRTFAADAVVGLRALAIDSGLDPARVTSRHCGFVLGPRINAAGRMADPHIALQLLLTDDEADAYRLAIKLSRLNAERQRIVQDMLDAAEESATANGEMAPLLVVKGEDWGAGLVGLVAGRLTERFNRPSVAVSVGADTSRASARSIEGFNIAEALAACEDILEEHGGHSRAAGLTIQTKNLIDLEERLIEMTDKAFGGTPPAPVLDIDAELHGRELNIDTARLVDRFEPFGEGNPAPRFLVRSVIARSPKLTRNGKHVQFQVETAGGNVARAIYFNGAGEFAQLTTREPIDLVFELKLDSWNGRNQVSLEVLDYRKTASA